MAEITIKQRFIHQAPRKLRLVADVIRGHAVDNAVIELMGIRKVAVQPVSHGLRSAIAAAKERHITSDSLTIAKITVDEGPALKRRILHARGRSAKMEHRMSHLTIVLSDANATPKPKRKINLLPTRKTTKEVK